MNDVNSAAPAGPPAGGARRSLQSWAREWNASSLTVWHAAQELGIPATRMAATITAANARRIYDRLFAQTTFTRLVTEITAVRSAVTSSSTSTRGSDKSAYLASTQAKADRAAAAARADVDLCECCDMPLPRSQPRGLCHECRSDGHQQIQGAARDLTLARRHADRFRTAYLRERDAALQAAERRQAADRRANNWGGALTRLVVEHDRDGKVCPVCKTPAPCAVWRKLERMNRPVADKILTSYYQLGPTALDRALNDGIVSEDEDDPPVYLDLDDPDDDGPDPAG